MFLQLKYQQAEVSCFALCFALKFTAALPTTVFNSKDSVAMAYLLQKRKFKLAVIVFFKPCVCFVKLDQVYFVSGKLNKWKKIS